MNLSIHLMNEKDVDEVLNISNLSLKESWSKESLLKEVTNPLAKYFLVKDNNKNILGFAGVWIIVDEGHITNVAIHPNFREKGLGTYLMNALIKGCKAEKCNSITLEVRESNVPALKLYEKLGFKAAGKRKKYYSDNNEDAIIMWFIF